MIQIDIPMPDNCDECRFNTEYGFCKAMPDNFCGNTNDRKRPEWCPLKEQEAKLPKKITKIGGLMNGICPNILCNAEINSVSNEMACGYCGQAVKWDA